MKNLKLSKEISLPIDVVTQTIAILAKRRAGKSYAMRKLAEQLLEAGEQIILIDPKGDQWGIRSSADGKKPGYPIIILGGEHGDAPLEVNSGEIVAKLAVEERVSILIDLSTFRKHEIATFMAIFLENLYRLKAQERFRTPVMLIIDEADAIAPQKPQKGEERMLGAADDIVRRGGQRGIGCALITQRSAVLNKNVLTQAQMLIVLRTIAPQDLAAMKAWIEVHGTLEEGKTLMDSLPSLPIGDAWFWSPGWPTAEGIFARSHVLPITTFDSAATPKPGERKITPKNLADVDMEALKKQMAATIEKAKADDPRELKKRISALEHELSGERKKKEVLVVDPGVVSKEVNRAVNDALNSNNKKWLTQVKDIKTQFVNFMESTIDNIVKSNSISDSRIPFKSVTARVEHQRKSLVDSNIQLKGPRFISKESLDNDESYETNWNKEFKISASMQKILNALRWLETISIKKGAKVQVAFIADQSPTSSGYSNNLSALKGAGYIFYPSPGFLSLTYEGRVISHIISRPANSSELHELIKEKLSSSRWTILDYLIRIYPESISKGELAEGAGQSSSSSAYSNNISALRSLGLIDYPQPGHVVALPILFLD